MTGVYASAASGTSMPSTPPPATNSAEMTRQHEMNRQPGPFEGVPGSTVMANCAGMRGNPNTVYIQSRGPNSGMAYGHPSTSGAAHYPVEERPILYTLNAETGLPPDYHRAHGAPPMMGVPVPHPGTRMGDMGKVYANFTYPAGSW